MQQLNVKFLNLPEPGPEARFVETAARAITLARAWASAARAAGLSDLLPPAAGADLRALLSQIDAREVLEPEAGVLMASVLTACGAALDAHPGGAESRRRSLDVILAQRDALLPVAAAIDEVLDLAAALGMRRDLGRK
jgi:hypothetical protein